MSYCRWSSDDHQCDVYVYEDVHGGWTTHVAGRRRKWLVPLPPPAPEGDVKALFERYLAVGKLCDTPTAFAWEDLPPEHAGATFNDPTPGECADRLESLRALGYQVPQYAIDELRAEAACP